MNAIPGALQGFLYCIDEEQIGGCIQFDCGCSRQCDAIEFNPPAVALEVPANKSTSNPDAYCKSTTKQKLMRGNDEMKKINVPLIAVALLFTTAGLTGCAEQTIKPLGTKLEVCEMINAMTKEVLTNYPYIKAASTNEVVQGVFSDMTSKGVKLDATQEWQIQQRVTQVATYAKSNTQPGEELMTDCLQLPDAQVGFSADKTNAYAQ